MGTGISDTGVKLCNSQLVTKQGRVVAGFYYSEDPAYLGCPPGQSLRVGWEDCPHFLVSAVKHDFHNYKLQKSTVQPNPSTPS